MLLGLDEGLAAETNPLRVEKDDLAVETNALRAEKDDRAVETNALKVEKDVHAAETNALRVETDDRAAETDALAAETDGDIEAKKGIGAGKGTEVGGAVPGNVRRVTSLESARKANRRATGPVERVARRSRRTLTRIPWTTKSTAARWPTSCRLGALCSWRGCGGGGRDLCIFPNFALKDGSLTCRKSFRGAAKLR